MSNVNESMRGGHFDISLDNFFAQNYSIPPASRNIQYILTDTTYMLSVEETPQQTIIPADSADKRIAKNKDYQSGKKDINQDNINLSDWIGSGASQSTADCKISGIEFIDAETFDDNLTFVEISKNHYSFTGRIGHRFDVDGTATLKGNQISLSGDKSTGILTLMDCKNLTGNLKTGPSKIPVRIVFKKK